jgi:hypothetical protein
MLKASKIVSGKFAQASSKYVTLQSTSLAKKSVLPIDFYKNPVDSATSSEELAVTDIASDDKLSDYRRHTGIDDTAPVIVAASQFVPIFQDIEQVYRALEIKDKSSQLTARTALKALTQEKVVLDAVAERKKELQSFIDSQEALDSIFSSFSSLYEFLKTQKYKDQTVGIGFSSILTRYSKFIQNYSSTKMWQQSLLELKNIMQSYTPHLVSAVPPPPGTAAADPYEIDGLDQTQVAGRTWINFYYRDLPPLPLLTSTTNQEQIIENIAAVAAAYDKLYIDLNSDPTSDQLIYVNSTIDRLSKTHKELAVLTTILAKEANYSRVINANFEHLKSVYGYDDATSAPQSLFDYLIGRFTKSSLDVPANPSGNGNSLVSLSQDLASTQDETLSILTFENSYVDTKKITPGAIYYVESALKTNDGSSFDTTNLSALKTKVKSAVSTADLVQSLTGYPLPQRRELLLSPRPLTAKPSDALAAFHSKFDTIKQIYAFSAKGAAPTTESSKLERLTASIFKTTVSPTARYEGAASSKIRAIIFLMLIQHIAAAERTRPAGAAEKSAQTVADKYLLDELKKALRLSRMSIKAASLKSIHNETLDLSKIVKTNTWKSAVDIMSTVLSDTIFNSDNATLYSKCDKSVYALACFDLIMRSVAAATPDVLEGEADTTTSVASQSRSTSFSRIDSAITSREIPLVISEFIESFSFLTLSKDRYAEYYDSRGRCIHHTDSIRQTETEGITEAVAVYVFNAYTSDLLDRVTTFENMLASTESTSFLKMMTELYMSDSRLTSSGKTSDDILALLNMSLTQEQIKLFYVALSEYTRRLDSSQDVFAKIPGLTKTTQAEVDCMPVRDIELVSYNVLSSFFNGEQYQPLKGNNKKILTVGLPPRLFRNIRHTGAVHERDLMKIREDLIRLRVFRIDHLNPELVFLPKEFVFEMSRFPTRVLQSWDHDALLGKSNFDPLTAPTVVVKGSNVALHRNFEDSLRNENRAPVTFSASDADIVEVLKETYKNHVNSFLLEEYLRWFTDCSFDEMQYMRYDKIQDQDPDYVREQYNNYDFMISTVGDYNNFAAVASMPSRNDAPKPVIKTDSPASKIVDLTSTLKRYFTNETFFVNSSTLKRQAAYPKKFDRVFTVIVDPDDFEIDTSAVAEHDLLALVKAGTIVSSLNSATGLTSYRLRDSSQGDPELDDFFVTVEPYDFTAQSVSVVT